MAHPSRKNTGSTHTKAKRVAPVLLAAVGMIAAFLFIRESHESGETPGRADAQAAPTGAPGPATGGKGAVRPSHKVIAYYFHGTFRCPSCHKIERYTQEAIETSFAGALEDGRLEWRVVNVDEPEYRHFIHDYGLYTKSVVLSDVHDGKEVKWKNLERVWRLLGNKEGFLDYIRSEVTSYLEGK